MMLNFFSKMVFGTVVLLIRTYAFFNRNPYILAGLCTGFGGVVAYQLYVDTKAMDRKPLICFF